MRRGERASRSAPVLRVAALLAVWYGSGVVTSLSTKEILRGFPYPITVAAIQQFVAAFGGWAAARSTVGSSAAAADLLLDWRLHARTVVPIAAVMVVALVSYRWSLMSASVAFTSTVKTLGPAFTIVFSRLALGERLGLARVLSVVPIILGVAITTITEAEFAWVGLVAAVLSTLAAALQSVLSKRVLRDREVRREDLFSLAAFYAFALLLPLFIVLDAPRIATNQHAAAAAAAAAGVGESRLRTTQLLLLNATCFLVNQYAGLSVLDVMSSPLSHALANVMKRAVIITLAMVWAAKPVRLSARAAAARSVGRREGRRPEWPRRARATTSPHPRPSRTPAAPQPHPSRTPAAAPPRPNQVSALHLCGIALSVFGALAYQQLASCCPAAEWATERGDAGASGYRLLPLRERDACKASPIARQLAPNGRGDDSGRGRALRASRSGDEWADEASDDGGSDDGVERV